MTEQEYLKTSTTMTSPSVKRSLMRAEDEPITLKKITCRLVCLSSSSMSLKRTVKPVVCRDINHEQSHEIQRQNFESEQIRTLLDQRWEQILADCQAEIRKHEFQIDYNRRSVQKLNETIESQQERLHRAQAEKRRRQDQQLLHELFLKQNWDLRDALKKSFHEMEELQEED